MALLQSSTGRKKISGSIPWYLKLFLLPTDTFLKAAVVDGGLCWGQGWILLGCLEHVGEAADSGL